MRRLSPSCSHLEVGEPDTCYGGIVVLKQIKAIAVDFSDFLISEQREELFLALTVPFPESHISPAQRAVGVFRRWLQPKLFDLHDEGLEGILEVAGRCLELG